MHDGLHARVAVEQQSRYAPTCGSLTTAGSASDRHDCITRFVAPPVE